MRHAVYVFVFTLLTLSTATRSAGATASFAVVMAQPPYEWRGDCRLCHQDPVGRAGSATRPFAETLKSQGLNASSTPSTLTQLLEGWDEQDSDGDERSDLEELLAGTDPNEGHGRQVVESVRYRYGCLHVAHRVSDRDVSWGLGQSCLLLGCLIRLRHRRRTVAQQSPDRHRSRET
jgi:hypothetical protein